jgi:phosphate transport system substrate-binding protein
VPVDLGGVALSYNLAGGPKNLKLDGPTLADIFLGTIKKWNDAAIKSLNPGVSLPDTSIVPVHRADSSGPGYDLDQYLINTAPKWASKVGTKASKTWPVSTVGVGQQLNTGVANYISQTAGAIGYVEYGYAKQAGFVNAALKNKAGSFVTPSISTISAAGANATDLSSTNFSIVDGPGNATYPLANFSWTVVYQKQPNLDKGEALGKVFDWVVTSGQAEASALGYAPLPANVVSLARSTLLQMQTSSGSPLFSH